MADQLPSTDRIFAAPGAGPPGGPQDSPRLVLVAIAVVVVALVWLVRLARRSSEFTPDYLAEVVLYALSAACVVMLLALGFVLARNLIKILAERRRAVPFARFRSKLVAALVGLTLIPSMLVLIVGSEVIRSSAERWFSAPIDDVLRSANAIARGVYQDQQQAAEDRAGRLAVRLAAVDLARVPEETLRDIVAEERAVGGGDVVDIYVVEIDDEGEATTTRLVEVADPFLPPGYPRASADALAASLAAGNVESAPAEPLSDGAELLRGAALVRATVDGPVVGVVVASNVLSGELTAHARRINGAFGTYNQLRVLTRPVTGVYLSFFLMTTLMILIAATWLGTYVAKRITRPVLQLAEGARQIGTGHLDHRIEPESSDEFGGMVEAFNAMAADLSTSQRKLIQSRGDLEHKTRETERRRRDTETILERIATGVVSIDAAGRLTTVNAAAARLLSLEATVIGEPAALIFERSDLAPLGAMLREARRGAVGQAAREVALARGGRECHLAVAATTLPGERGLDGVVMVFDDVTPLFRAQRVATWRDVARRLAHEIKNPLTPIQLCAERLRRNLATAAPQTRELVNECTSTIVGEVEALKGLVDEFSHFARLPSPRAVPADINVLLADTLSLYAGLFDGITIEATYDPGLPVVRLDPDQIQRVVVNLVDNAAAALGGDRGRTSRPGGTIGVATYHDATNHVARVTVSDNGPGIAEVDRDKLFLPYFSTKGRGSGLGLAIVRRIVVEHGGSIQVTDNRPRGTRFSIELPCGASALDETPVVAPAEGERA
ncbi:MAG TPA: HAMP domain-containing protein [Acidobacteria bacterium]|nr:HAMP domain-containing protein [Acidobacteriota bacterium]